MAVAPGVQPASAKSSTPCTKLRVAGAPASAAACSCTRSNPQLPPVTTPLTVPVPVGDGCENVEASGVTALLGADMAVCVPLLAVTVKV